jgi:hypothetical protein
MGVARLGEELYQTGMNAQRAGMLFASFGEQVGSTSALLERLRATTRGVVDDTTLMSAASSQLSMGLAKNADDVERLTNIGVTFAQAMGQDIGSSMENLNMLLANQSYLRLDTLGISSSAVRELAGQYRAAGKDTAEAFTLAFMDVAEAKLPQMDAVADAMVTPLQQMSASLENWWTDFGNRFAQGVNGLVGMVTHLGDVLNIVLDAVPGGGDVPMDVGATMGSGGMSIGGGPTGVGYAQWVRMQARNGNTALFTPYQQSAFDLFGYSPRRGNAMQLMNGSMTNADYDAAIMSRFMQNYGAAYSGMSEGGQFQAMQSARRGQVWGQFAPWYQALGSDVSNGARLGGVQVFSQDDVSRANEVMEILGQAWEKAQSFFPDNQLDMMRQMYEAAQGMADAIQQGADALDSMSLPEIFGQGSGGRLGQIDAAILSQMEAGGASADTIDALRRALGLDSGMLTEASVQFDEQIAPQLALLGEQWGADAVIAARTAYERQITAAAANGQGGQALNNWSAVLAGSTGLSYTSWGGQAGGPGGSYTVKPGDTLGAIAGQFGFSTTDFASMTGVDNPSFIRSGQTLNWGGGGMGGGGFFAPENFDMLEQSMMQAETSASNISDEMQTAADTLQSGVDAVFGKTYQLPIELVISGAGIIGQLVAAAVGANGGTVPGSSTNTGRSSAGTRGAANDGTRTRGR